MTDEKLQAVERELRNVLHVRTQAVDRDLHRCRHCGTDKRISACYVDPAKPSKVNHIDNIITLCKDCDRAASAAREMTDLDGAPAVGVVLCGGTGSRLAPLTLHHNKHELPVGPIPMVFHPIKTLRSLGVRQAVIVVDRYNVGDMVQILGSGKEFGMEFCYAIQEGPGGIADALLLTQPIVRDNNLCVILGDNVFDNGEFKEPTPLGGNKACVFLKEVADPRDYGVATLEEGKVTEIVEKPTSPKSNQAVTGLYCYTSDVFNVARDLVPSGRGELEISDINDFYAKRGELTYELVSGFWGDAGSNFEQYYAVCDHVLKHQCSGL